jgi:glycosyltransferase involved in cell wall biosynthesis
MIRTFLHDKLWQALPRGLRRRVLFGASGLLAPRASGGTAGGPPYIVAGVLRSPTGLGRSARLCHDALKAMGLPVHGIDLTTALYQSPTLTEFSFADGRELEGQGTLILHVNAPLVPLAMLAAGRRAIRGKRIIGYWAWELEHAPADWNAGVAHVHEIWTPSRFSAAAMVPVAGGKPVHVVPHPVAIDPPAEVPATAPAPGIFTVLSVFDATSSLARKNPLGAVAAFRLAFPDDPDVRLVLKTANLARAGEAAGPLLAAADADHRIRLVDAEVSESGMSQLFADCDVLLSLHRSEGFGLTLAEAMLHGLPVVATCWSGEADFLTRDIGFPVSHGFIAAHDPQGTYDLPGQRWADPSLDEAADALRRLRADPALRRGLGKSARARALSLWSTEAYGANVLQAVMTKRVGTR